MVFNSKILLLEDDEVLRSLILDTLVDEGYYVSDAASPQQALDLFSRECFDLLITDVRMAGMTDGLGVLSQLKRKRPTLKSIVITGYTDISSPAQAMQCQADDYLFKGARGFGVNLLLDVVQRVLQAPAPSSGWLHSLARKTGGLLRFSWLKTDRKQLSQLEAARQSSLKVFYLGICSGHFSAEVGQELWDGLLSLEACCLALQPSNSKRIGELISLYEQLSNCLIENLPFQCGEPPADSNISYRSVHGSVREKQIGFADFVSLPRLLIDPSQRKQSAYHFSIYEMLSGSAPSLQPAAAPIEFRLAGFELTKELEPWGERRRFRARHLESAGSRVVEHLTVEEIEAELRTHAVPGPSSFERLDSQQQLLVRPWDDWAPTLAREIARGPLSLAACLEVLDPIWSTVEGYHRAGIADGFLSPDRFVWQQGQYSILSFGATSLYQLSQQIDYTEKPDAPFSLWHCDLTNLERSAPGPLNDQFSLAVILCQLLTGSSDPLSLVWSCYDPESGELRDLDLGTVDAELTASVSKMLSLEPGQRFPDLKSAREALGHLSVNVSK